MSVLSSRGVIVVVVKFMHASCQCGNFLIEWDVSLKDLTARRCSCDYCALHEAEYISQPNTLVKVQIIDESKHNIVKHGQGIASFHESSECGLVLVSSEIEQQMYCVINVKGVTLGRGYLSRDSVNHYSVDPIVNDFSHETVVIRQERRRRNWSLLKVSSSK